MNQNALPVLSAAETARFLPYPELVAAIGKAAAEYAAGKISAPERQALAYPGGGSMLSMPAVGKDLGVHKLVNVLPQNSAVGLPTILGVVSVYDALNGQALMILDGPTVTARRTAAVTVLGIQALWTHGPRHIALIGHGRQAMAHAQALLSLYPQVRLTVVGRQEHKAQQAVGAWLEPYRERVQAGTQVPDAADVVIALTTSLTPVYQEVARPERLLVGVGAFRPEMAEFPSHVLQASRIFVDDTAGARHEAGDLIQAGVDWTRVQGIHEVLRNPVPHDVPLFYKTVGCAAWDLAAARCALQCRENAAGQ